MSAIGQVGFQNFRDTLQPDELDEKNISFFKLKKKKKGKNGKEMEQATGILKDTGMVSGAGKDAWSPQRAVPVKG